MRENRVKKVMAEGKLALGTYVTFADPQVVEIIGLAGYDAAFIDMEHTTFDLALVTEMIRAADLVGITSIVRVPDNDEKLILRLLDAGAEGIIVPHVDGLEGAKRAVEAVRYGPLGHRGGAGGTRATRYGMVSWDDHVQQSNEQILLSVMTEDEKGIADIEAIAGLEANRPGFHRPHRLLRVHGHPGPVQPRAPGQDQGTGGPDQGNRQGQNAVPHEPRRPAHGPEGASGARRGIHPRRSAALRGPDAVAAGASAGHPGAGRVGGPGRRAGLGTNPAANGGRWPPHP